MFWSQMLDVRILMKIVLLIAEFNFHSDYMIYHVTFNDFKQKGCYLVLKLGGDHRLTWGPVIVGDVNWFHTGVGCLDWD
jgi:hypothetical protein